MISYLYIANHIAVQGERKVKKREEMGTVHTPLTNKPQADIQTCELPHRPGHHLRHIH